MLDARLRPLVDRVLSGAGARLAGQGVGPNAVTVTGLVLGLAGAAALAFQAYSVALLFLLANRLCDGLDGAVARHAGASDFGGFLDIVCDFIVYAGFVFGFALGRPDQALPAAFLIFSFIGTGTSFLAFAVIAAKRGIATTARGRKAFYYLGGLTEGTETTALLVAISLFPGWFPWLAWGFGALCWITTFGRTLEARSVFRDAPPHVTDSAGPGSSGP
ncbi:MAG: CDP-alcohol phosphatidyltransferase family protein [Alphaproteobacteria bacterium]|jgi:phosphatidylglycerophosphate synthase|nr:CDP-alcohol phosphatidyltransferase family protein [Alphaproteobacteria bacterium]